MSIKINPGVKLGPGTSAKVPVPPPTLTVNIAGSGSGFVTSSPAGINVSSGSASHAFALGTSVTLNAASAMGSSFSGWAGAASGTGSAHITMDQDQTVTATFNLNTPPPPALIGITVLPGGLHLPNGRTAQFTATALFSDGSQQDYTDQAIWSSPGFSVVNISSSGLVTAVAPGTTTISAGYGFVSGSTTITVTSATLVVIGISPPTPAVAQDGTIQLTATGTFSDGSQLDLSTQVLWSSTNGAIASIDANGLATGHSDGNCTIQANLNGVQSSVTLFVGS